MFDVIQTIDNLIQYIKGRQMCGLMVSFNLILESLWFSQLNILTDKGLVFL